MTKLSTTTSECRLYIATDSASDRSTLLERKLYTLYTDCRQTFLHSLSFLPSHFGRACAFWSS